MPVCTAASHCLSNSNSVCPKADKGFSYGWAKRHTWQSWRERYKMNQEWFDEQITEHLDAFPPHPHGKGEYALKRMPRAPRTRQIASRPIPENSEDNEEGTAAVQPTSQIALRHVSRPFQEKIFQKIPDHKLFLYLGLAAILNRF